jgi:hypothetical protein
MFEEPTSRVHVAHHRASVKDVGCPRSPIGARSREQSRPAGERLRGTMRLARDRCKNFSSGRAAIGGERLCAKLL